ncbi:hypothetical protein KFE25_007654 [Diacronema lutheri]|uniref:16S rRNA m7G methyltransferase n=1 Tax=Diacronema lutheri TaxID=2081491 RepID=A0A8J5XHQ3_DIALT|nr:hypothetical protein KFE25_007654 [Diacronema lutheri]
MRNGLTSLLVPHILWRTAAPPCAPARALRASAGAANDPSAHVDERELDAVLRGFSAPCAALAKRYVAALVEYNAHTNVYSQGAYGKLPFHVHDSLTLGALIARAPGGVLDMGSGSGLPSVCVAIANPSIPVYAVESKGRKAIFLTSVARELGLANLHVLTENIVELSRASAFDVAYVTAKAFKPLPHVIPLAKKAIRARARLLVPISEAQVVEHSAGWKRVLDPAVDLERVGPFIYFSREIKAASVRGGSGGRSVFGAAAEGSSAAA